MSDEHPTYIDIHIDSLHVGHKSGMYYNGRNFDYKPNPANRWLWKVWNMFWEEVEQLIEKHNPSHVHLSMLGEAGDIDYKMRSNEFWTKDYDVVKDNAIEVLERPMKLVDGAHFFRGTDAHVGSGGTLDELIASEYESAIPTEDGKFAHLRAEYELGGVLFDVQHKGKNRSKWGDTNLITALREEIILDRTHNKRPVPDVITRGHFHWLGATDINVSPLVVQVPSFQLPYKYIHDIDAVGRTPIVGGVVFIIKNRKVTYEPITYTFPRSKVWKQK